MPGRDDELMTVAEIAAILKLNQQTVRNWIDAGRLPAHRLGRRVRVRRSDFDHLVAGSYSSRRAVTSGDSIQGGIWEGHIGPPVVRW
jgi:excisionase family DNA binding protein